MKLLRYHVLPGLALSVLMVGLAGPCLGWQSASDTPATGKTSQDRHDDRMLSGQFGEIGETIDRDPTAREVSAGLLQPIYQAAEYIAFPAFYWVAFMIMVAGVVGFAGQLVLTKLLLLVRGSLNLREILADALGLVISLVGLILTTQAATENSGFTTSPLLVLSSAGVGILAGLVFYVWGQRTEFDAVTGSHGQRSKKANQERRTRI